jgi:predicted DNA-binding transcriptional regulator AlpA
MKNTTSTKSASRTMTLKQIVKETGLSESYVRKCIARGKLNPVLTFIGKTRIPRNIFKRSNVNAWRKTVKA